MDQAIAVNHAARQIVKSWAAGENRTGTDWLALYGMTVLDPDGWRKAGIEIAHPVSYDAFHALLESSTTERLSQGFTDRVFEQVDRLQLITARTVLNLLIRRCYGTAMSKGFWEGRTKDLNCDAGRQTALSELMLVVTELAEGAEGVRHGNPPDDKVPAYDSLTAECSDTIIRLLDMAGGHDLPLADCLVEKMAFNHTRPHKHGKKL